MDDVRLIDANALKEDLKNMLARVMYESDLDFDHSHAKIWTATITGIQHSIKRLDKAPTIDAVTVVHGRWARDEADENWFACSVCKGENGPWHKFAECTYKFCPWCGAKMDGGAAND